MPVQTGLPYATRTFALSAALLGAPTNPTNLHGELSRQAKGRRFIVDTYNTADFDADGTGNWTITVQPDTHGEFFLRVWTSGDPNKQDIEISFIVPAPG